MYVCIHNVLSTSRAVSPVFGGAINAILSITMRLQTVRFQVITAVCVKMTVFFWVVAQCSRVEVYRRFGGA
jgi:ABC-type transport system involved in Fe-S cluster assembly fused permease/ATPase subunit